MSTTTHEQDALEKSLSSDGVEARITGPGGTTGSGAIAAVLQGVNPTADDGALFDTGPYVEAVEIDGHSADKLKIDFGGSIEFDPSDETSRTLYESLRLGKPVELRVSGHVAKKNGGWKENAEGETVVTGTAGIKVTSLHLLTPEDL